MRASLGVRTTAFLLAAIPGLGCASYSHVRFAPPVQETDLRGDAGGVEARIVVAWRGVVERDGRIEFRFRMRIDNPSDSPFTLVPADFELLDGALAPVGEERSEQLPISVDPRGSAIFNLAFEVPGSDEYTELDLSSLTLRTSLQGGRWNWSSSFERAYREYYDPYYSPWHVNFGVGFVYH